MIPTIRQDELIKRIKVNLESKPHTSNYSHFSVAPSPTEPALYVLILGAGFSDQVVPLVKELMHMTIGEYYYPDQDQWSVKRPADVLRRDAACFWTELNQAAVAEEFPPVQLDTNGLPKNPGAAYQYLFTAEAANALFSQRVPKKPSFLEQLRQQRLRDQGLTDQREMKPRIGKRFVDGFLRYVMDPGGEHGLGSTGRNELNPAHIYLAALLEAQQLGRAWMTSAFCRTIITTNFDTLLQNALQMVNLLYRLSDRPEKGLDRSDFCVEEGPIHLVYAHGSILRHNPANTIGEVGGLEYKNVDVLRDYLKTRDVITIGYSGWNDGLMKALQRCDSRQHNLYWCDVRSQPSSHIASFLTEWGRRAVYVHLGKSGADGFMRDLYQALIPAEKRRDPMQRYRDWCDLVWNRKTRRD